jgi:hypothetical protein
MTWREGLSAITFAVLGALWARRVRRRDEAHAREVCKRAGVF